MKQIFIVEIETSHKNFNDWIAEHDNEVRNKALDEYNIWTNNQVAFIDAKTHQLIVARNGIWVDALDTYKKEELKNQN